MAGHSCETHNLGFYVTKVACLRSLTQSFSLDFSISTIRKQCLSVPREVMQYIWLPMFIAHFLCHIGIWSKGFACAKKPSWICLLLPELHLLQHYQAGKGASSIWWRQQCTSKMYHVGLSLSVIQERYLSSCTFERFIFQQLSKFYSFRTLELSRKQSLLQKACFTYF